MTQTLPQVGHEHHARILASLDAFPALADALIGDNPDSARDDLIVARDFLNGTLLPHIQAAEQAVYPQLERMFQNRHSMAPMRREHEEIRRLVATFAEQATRLQGTRVSLGHALAIRRVMFQLYALLKVHLAEEEAYLRIIDHGVAADVGELVAASLEHPIG